MLLNKARCTGLRVSQYISLIFQFYKIPLLQLLFRSCQRLDPANGQYTEENSIHTMNTHVFPAPPQPSPSLETPGTLLWPS